MNWKLMWGVLLANGLLLVSNFSYAADDDLLRVKPSVGISSYALSLGGGGATSPDATSLYMVAGGSVTYATGKLFFDATASSSLGASHDWPGYEGDFQRTDFAFTLGYLLDKGWSVFGGYKWGQSEFKQDNVAGYTLTFEAYGLFGGVSKSIPLNNGSSLTLSGALAFMTGDIYDTATLSDSGSTIGTSVAVSYNKPLSDSTGMQLRGFYQYYNFSDFTSVSDTEEIIFGALASYYIDF